MGPKSATSNEPPGMNDGEAKEFHNVTETMEPFPDVGRHKDLFKAPGTTWSHLKENHPEENHLEEGHLQPPAPSTTPLCTLGHQ